MDLYLVQHGEARRESEDPERPLTDRGRAEAERVARAAARAGLRVDRIVHSGKLRARQTAEILASALDPPQGLGELNGLAPNDDPGAARAFAESAAGTLMLVGHLPHLSQLSSLLLADDPSREIVLFRMAAIVALSKEETRWRLRFVLTPEIAS